MFVARCVERKIPVIPVLLPGGDFPAAAPFLRELQCVEFEDSIEEAVPFARLVWGITGDRAQYERLSVSSRGVSADESEALVRRAVAGVLHQVPALTKMKLTIGVELYGTGGTHRLRVGLPALDVTLGSAQDARVHLRASRVVIRRMVGTAKLTDWRDAVRAGNIQVSGDDKVLAVIEEVVEDHLSQKAPKDAE